VAKLDDAGRQAYVALIRRGGGLMKAARDLKISYAAVKAARRADPEFDTAVVEALEEAAEPIELVLYEAASRGEPWAVQMWLKARMKDRGYGEQPVKAELTVSGGVEIEAGARLAGIRALELRLAERQRALESGDSPDPSDIIDVESVEVNP
jgi:hypothetical protein